MDALALIVGSAVLAWMIKRPSHAAAVKSAPIQPKHKRAAKMPQMVKRSIAVVTIEPESKIGHDIMPHGWSYPIPYNEPFVNVFLAFNAPIKA